MKKEFIHAGYPGDNTAAMLRRMKRDVLSHVPSCVIVQCGTNDAVNPRASVPVKDFSSNMESIISAVQGAQADLLLIAPPPVISAEVIARYGFDLPPETDLNPKISMYADVMRLLAERNRIPFLDFFHIFNGLSLTRDLIRNESNSSAKDGAHPTETGYRFIAALVYQALLDHHCDCSRVVCFGDSITHGYPFPGMGTLSGCNYPALLHRLFNQEK